MNESNCRENIKKKIKGNLDINKYAVKSNENLLYKVTVKCQDMDDPGLTVKNARTSMTLTKKVTDSDSQLVVKCIYQIFTKIELQRVYLGNNNGFNIRVDEVF